MIAHLSGIVALKSPDHIVLDVHGVGYRVLSPFSTYYELPEEGGNTSLHIHTAVREDAIVLYGFRSITEKEFFQLLIGVSGVGPKLARDILSNIQPAPLAAALQHGDIGKLSAIPGIGKKTAERLIVELREKVRKISLPEGSPEISRESVQNHYLLDDVTSALINLGYKEALVKKALMEIDNSENGTVEEVLKKALKLLMK